jgi:hypothetical protein
VVAASDGSEAAMAPIKVNAIIADAILRAFFVIMEEVSPISLSMSVVLL